jgi:beta-mannosidase
MDDAVKTVEPPRTLIDRGWELAGTAAGVVEAPAGLPRDLGWLPAEVPGTVASALRRAKLWSLETPAALHDRDWWYRVEFAANGPQSLVFHGLATLADIWIDGLAVARSESMFVAQDVDFEALGRATIHICFRSLTRSLAGRRARARWRPRLVKSQALRGVRTTLLGHMPGWCPPVDIVGPWRAVERIELASARPRHLDIKTSVSNGNGVLRVSLALAGLGDMEPVLACAGAVATMSRIQGGVYGAELTIPDVAPWWPHTHGTPNLHAVTVRAGQTAFDLGKVGFRTLEIERGAGGAGFCLTVNGAKVFCRGAVWTTAGLVEFPGDRAKYRRWLELARDGGMNMVRIAGTNSYEETAFYEVCDELGLMVWQDYMFANFDYPATDAAFMSLVKTEVTQFLERTQGCPSLSVLCGGSEVFQQAAMLGLSQQDWANPLFDDLLPALSRDLRPDAIFVPNSPCGGTLPFSTNFGVAHYFGVGGYLRELSDARSAGVKFASECLALANVPQSRTLSTYLPVPPVHHPAWKAAIPRDAATSWDFDDVRDHYLETLYCVDARQLRQTHPERYLNLSRAVSAEVMGSVVAEWRRADSGTAGALVLGLQDLVPGAGWGVIDSTFEPKAAWYGLKREFRTVHVTLTDEGLNGLLVHLINELPCERPVVLSLIALQHGRLPIVRAVSDIVLKPRSALPIPATTLAGGFFDWTYAYRFGPPTHDITIARLADKATGATISESFHFPLGRGASQHRFTLAAVLDRDPAGWFLRITSDRFAQSVHIEDDHFRPDDDWFHLAPLGESIVRLHARIEQSGAAPVQTPAGTVSAINAEVTATYGQPR